MKILEISGKNIASLQEEFLISFEEDPLSQAGLFAITGRTGSGKSTILDTMCLALFDTTPRLSSKVDIVDIQDVSGDTIKQADSRTLLRRGATNGYAQVIFEGVDGRHYKARWEVYRAYNKANGKLQASSLHLSDRDTGEVLADKKKLFAALIEEKLGLTFEQFTRSVLLAQGEFANFLKAKDDEKAEILEKLTGTDIYSIISRKLYLRSKEDRKCYERIQERIEVLEILEPEEHRQLREEVKEIDLEVKALRNKDEELQKAKKWFYDYQMLKQKKADAETAFLAAQKEKKEAEQRYSKMKEMDLASEPIQAIREIKKDEEALMRLLKNINNDEGELVKKQESFDTLKEKEKNNRDALEKLKEEANQLEPKLENARKLDAIGEQKEKDLRDFEKKEKDLMNKISEEDKEIKKVEDKLKEQQLSEKKLKDWKKENCFLEDLSRSLPLFIDLYKREAQFMDQVINRERKLESNKKLLSQLKTSLENHKEVLKEIETSAGADIINLRKKLVEGKPCPVCGSCHHNLSVFVGNESEMSFEELEQKKVDLETQIEKDQKSYEDTNNTILKLNGEIQNAEEELKSISKQVKQELPEKIRLRIEKENDFKKRIKALNQMNKQWESNEEKLQKTLKEISESQTSLSNRSEISKHKKEQFESLQNDIKQKQEELERIQEEISKLFGGEDYKEIEKTQKTKIEREREKEKTLREEVTNIEKEIVSLKSGIDTTFKEHTHIKNNITTALKIVQDWCSEKDIAKEKLDMFANIPPEKVTKEKNELSKISDNFIKTHTTYEEREKDLNNKLEEFNPKPLKDNELEYVIDEQTGYPDGKQLEEAIGKIEKQLQENQNQLTEKNTKLKIDEEQRAKQKELIADLQKSQEKVNRSEALSNLLGSSEGNKFRRLAQGYTLDVLLDVANIHLHMFTKRYSLVKIDKSLSLAVIDHEMMDEKRSVLSLSGGESFIVSLSLALGLSTLSSQKIHIGTMFIDEGFGALDKEVLTQALDALQVLQNQGRSIGVISHVSEMNESIPTQIRVVRQENGRSRIEVIS